MIHTRFHVGRLVRALARRAWDALRGETAATFFDPFHRHDLARLLAEFDIPLPRSDSHQADVSPDGAGRIVIDQWNYRPYSRRFPMTMSSSVDGELVAYLKSEAGRSLWGLSEKGRRNLLAWLESRPFDRVRQVYELRPDVREVFPLGLTPAQRGEYARWLFRYARDEYGFRDTEILWYLCSLTEDPSCGLSATYRLSPRWQQAVPDALTPEGWTQLKAWVARSYSDRVGRWLRRAKLPDAPVGEGPSPQHPSAMEKHRGSERVATEGGPYPATVGAALRGGPASQASDTLAPRAINILGHFKYESGLQEEAVRHADSLAQAGYRVYLRDVPVSYPRDWRDGGQFTDLETGPVTLIKTGANDPLDDVYHRAGLHPRRGVYRIACWSWELEAFPQRAVDRGGLADEVWTPSEFCAQSVRSAMPGKPVFAMPPAVVVPETTRCSRGSFGLPDDHFLFLFVFDMASGMERKNPLGLIRAFRQAFHPTEPVHLAIKVSRGAAYPADFRILQASAEAAGVTLIDRVMPRAEVCDLLASCDSYASLHRSEGFGFTMAEAMLLGKPTIATGYSGNLDFMTSDNSYLVQYDRVPLDQDYPPYLAGCIWASPCESHAAERMRHVYENRDEAAAIEARGRETVATFLSPAAAARRITTRLAEIQKL